MLKKMVRYLFYKLKNIGERSFNIRVFNKLRGKYGHLQRYKRVNDVKFLNFTFDVPDLPSFIWQFKELFIDGSYKFISQSNEPVIIDCGANIGTSCVFFKHTYPRAKIMAFEADKDIVKILKSNLQKNNINDISIIGSAVWIHDDGIEFSPEGADGGSIQRSGNKNRVSSIRLKNILERQGRVDLLKIDIEGAEYEVMKDCSNSLGDVENIFIEYHSWNHSKQKLSEILAILEKNNFRYFIEGVCDRKQPFVNKGGEENMDLQLNIFGVRRSG